MPARKGSVEAALDAALKTVSLQPADGAATALARELARAVDGGEEPLWRTGPRLLEVLVELGMTPKARAAVAGGKAPPADPTLDELRARREKRVSQR